MVRGRKSLTKYPLSWGCVICHCLMRIGHYSAPSPITATKVPLPLSGATLMILNGGN